METKRFLICLIVMAGVTYLIRLLPMLIFKNEIKNKFVVSFLHYIPYAVLSAMTVPAVFYATSSPVSAVAGFIVAIILSLFKQGLITVALASCVAVFAAELLLK